MRAPPIYVPAPVDTTATETRCLAGIDEAGLGPILGPLVVAGAALVGPKGGDPWRLLRRSVSRDGRGNGRLRVADSKKVHQGPHGLMQLERTSLAFLRAWRGAMPATLEELLALFGHDLARLRGCPWYEDLALPLPLRADPGDVELAAHRLVRELAGKGVRLHHIALRAVEAEEWNGLIAASDNKSRAHFETYANVIGELLRQVPGGTHVVADRCGGIAHYGPGLRRHLPGLRIGVLDEGGECSSYELGTSAGPIRITFAVGGEERAFPTALGSCLAKYVRELMVHLINRWFTARVPGLKPTAGYFTDGRRFLADVGSLIRTPGFPRGRLIRCR
jgi:ribonuclease HII